jgi:uncharacterized protein YcnI
MIRRLSTVLTAFVVAILLTPATAYAHIEIITAQPNGDGSTTLTFGFDHSCTNADTTELTVVMPAEATASKATGPARWNAAVAGNRVTWTGPATKMASGFSVVARIIARPGQALLFRTLQRCADGDLYRWIDIQADAEHPAPRLIATGSILAGQPSAAPSVSGTAPPPSVGLGGVVAVLIGFVVAAAAIGHWLARRTDPPQVPSSLRSSTEGG